MLLCQGFKISNISPLTNFDQICFVPQRELEGAVSLGEAESTWPVITLEVMVHSHPLPHHQPQP